MRSVRAWRYWPWARDLGLALLLLAAIRAWQQRDAAGGVAPSLAGIDLHGAPLSLADYRGKPVIVHFWATWCRVCSAEQANIDAIARELPVLSVASQSGSSQQVAAYVRAHDVVPKVVVDATGTLAKRFGVRMFPTTFVLDGSSEVRHVEVGYTTELGLRLRMWLAGL
jgi:thiol-disulfide isomerase/thioredoxin